MKHNRLLQRFVAFGLMCLFAVPIVANAVGYQIADATVATGYDQQADSASYESDGTSWQDYCADYFAGGSGTEEDPYVIETTEQLALLAKYANDQEEHYNSAYYVLRNDLDLGGHLWVPIGAIKNYQNAVAGFEGVLEGNNHVISNMEITKDIEDIYYFGLFGQNCGEVRNLILREPRIQFESNREGWQASNGAGSNLAIGSICGDLLYGVMENCSVFDALIDVRSPMSLICGGVVGICNYSNMDNVYATGDIRIEAARAIWVGGCIGNLDNELVVENSGFTGNIYSESYGQTEFGEYAYVHFVGGFVGDAGRANSDITMRCCYANASIYSAQETSGTQWVGGFAGGVGVVHDYACYENLVCKATITTDRAGVISTEQNFWQGESPFAYQGKYAQAWYYNNCVEIWGDEVRVTNYTSASDFVCDVYSTEGDTLTGVMIDRLGFGSELWDFSGENIALKTHKFCTHENIESVQNEGSCTEASFVTYTCTDCGKTDINTIQPALGHEYGLWVLQHPATCVTDGEETRNCARCGLVETRTLPATGHQYEQVHHLPSCTEDGRIERRCIICNDRPADDVIPAWGHDFYEWTIIKSATEESEGKEERGCSRCAYVESRIIPKLEHIHNYCSVVTAPDCVQDGYVTNTCRCGHTYITEGTAALGHDFDLGKCTRCGAKDENNIVNNPFVDVAERNFFYRPVLWAVNNGVTAGVSVDHFAPDQTCTRGQVVTFLWRAMGRPEPNSSETVFADVAPDSFYYKAVLWAVENGITAGLNQTTFGPDEPCTRGQVVTFLWRALGRAVPETTANPFMDVPETQWYYTPVLWAVENGITAGTSATTFAPSNPCTRGQVVTFLYRAMKGE